MWEMKHTVIHIHARISDLIAQFKSKHYYEFSGIKFQINSWLFLRTSEQKDPCHEQIIGIFNDIPPPPQKKKA